MNKRVKLLLGILVALLIHQTTSPAITIQVQTPDGQPLPNITVVCLGPNDKAILHATAIEGGTQRMQTDADGRFHLTLNSTNLAVAVASEVGFNLSQSRDLTNNSTLIVQPWARLAGVRMNGNRPLANEGLRWEFNWWCLGLELWGRLILGQPTTTDAQGHFAFAFVPPTEIVLCELHQPQRKQNKTDLSVTLQYLDLKPGETRDVKLDITTRTMVGRLVFGDDLNSALDLTSCFAGIRLPAQTHFTFPVIPKEFDQPAKRIKWWHDFWFNTDAGRKFIHDQLTQRFFDIQPDGSFRAVSVAPGKYETWGDLHQENGKRVAAVEKILFDIPKLENPADDTPYTLGKLKLLPAVKLKPGDSAPDFTFKTLDDQSLKLSDFRGKYVLLDFWATWCGPCIAETPNLKATYDKFGQNEHFAMISLSLDSDPAAPKKFARNQATAWTQGFLGEWSNDKVTPSYGVYGIPAIFLIGPDGKIANPNLRGTAIKAAVSAALAH